MKVWATLRFDDHRGIDPHKLRMCSRGLHTMLTRSKTSGPNKKDQFLPLNVSRNAILVHPDWLATGLTLWQSVDTKRDILLAMPTKDR